MKTKIKQHTPFEFNDANNYYWHKQGKKHFWGYKGKDYGLLDSLQQKNRNQERSQLDNLKNQHLKFEKYQYDDPKANYYSDIQPVQIKPVHYQQYLPEVDRSQQKNYYSLGGPPPQRLRMQTEPIQYSLDKNRVYNANNSRISQKKRNLSLLSRNISINNQNMAGYNPAVRQQPKTNQKDLMIGETMPNRNFHARIKSESDNYNDLNQYRQRIVNVVKRDRKNNPTFCNSLAYPLHCYRYIE